MTDFSKRITEDNESALWKVEARADRKVNAIRAFRAATGAGLKEAKDVVMEYFDRVNRGEMLNGPNNAVTTSYVNLPDGGCLSVITNGMYTAITYSTTEAANLTPDKVAQAIADATLKYSR